MSVTIDPESSKDGIFWPRMSMVMDGHCETALLRTHCLVSKDTTWFVNVLRISSNLAAGMEDDSGSTLTPPLHPWPWEAGVFSLTHYFVAADELRMPSLACSLRQFLSLCPMSLQYLQLFLGLLCHQSQLRAEVLGVYPEKVVFLQPLFLLIWMLMSEQLAGH